MAAQLIESTDIVECVNLPILIFGPPGVGKSSLAQTANKPLTLDFDKGIHRVENRRVALRFDTWSDAVAAAGAKGVFTYPAGHKYAGQPIDYQTLILDTGGKAIETMIPPILAESAKNGYAGNLTPQGWGVLGGRFTIWLKTVLSWGKDVVMICHEEEKTNASGASLFVPDLPGKMSWKAIHKDFDMIGRLYHIERRRVLDFRPYDTQVGKNAANFEQLAVDNLHAGEPFLADLIANAKKRIGQTAVASAAVAAAVEKWNAWIRTGPSLEAFNSGLADLSEMEGSAKKQAWLIVSRHAEVKGWKFDKATKSFVEKGSAV